MNNTRLQKSIQLLEEVDLSELSNADIIKLYSLAESIMYEKESRDHIDKINNMVERIEEEYVDYISTQIKPRIPKCLRHPKYRIINLREYEKDVCYRNTCTEITIRFYGIYIFISHEYMWTDNTSWDNLSWKIGDINHSDKTWDFTKICQKIRKQLAKKSEKLKDLDLDIILYILLALFTVICQTIGSTKEPFVGQLRALEAKIKG